MPRRRTEEIEFVEEVPARSGGGTRWAQLLLPLTRKGGIGRPALIKTMDTPEQAMDAQSNLTQRRVRIPEPDGRWEFYSRGVEVFAIYRGKNPARRGTNGRTSVRRAK